MKLSPRPSFCCLKYSSLFGFYSFIYIKVRSLRSEDARVLKSRIFQPCGTGSGFVFWGDWTSAFVTLNLNLSSARRGNPEQIPEEPQHLQHSNHQTPLNPPNSETDRGHFPGPRHRLQPKHSPQSRFVPTKAETSAWSTDVAWAPHTGPMFRSSSVQLTSRPRLLAMSICRRGSVLIIGGRTRCAACADAASGLSWSLHHRTLVRG